MAFLAIGGALGKEGQSHWIFVLVMEYLSQALKIATAPQHFRYHPGRHGLKLNMLSFADDLLIFCRADTTIVKDRTAFKRFWGCSGLEGNIEKSQIVAAEVPEGYWHWQVFN